VSQPDAAGYSPAVLRLRGQAWERWGAHQIRNSDPSGGIRDLDRALDAVQDALVSAWRGVRALRDPEAGPVARTYAAYEREIERRGGLDFDDLVARSLRLLATDPDVLARWRERCTHLLVDGAQDLDRSQLRLALLLAAPANRIFLVGDDDQSIYGWRLAEVNLSDVQPAPDRSGGTGRRLMVAA